MAPADPFDHRIERAVDISSARRGRAGRFPPGDYHAVGRSGRELMSLANWTAGAGAGALTALVLSGQALAQSAPTCSFDAATATVTVAANGGNASTTATAGRIVL